MKTKLLYLMVLIAGTTFANVKVDISNKLMQVTENMVINGLDQGTDEGVIFVTESLHIENGSRIEIRNACLIIMGNITGTGILDVDDSATVTLEGEKKGKITFTNNFLADATCQQTTGEKTFKNIQEVPLGLNYSLYNMSGRLLTKDIVDEYIHNYMDPKTYFIKIDGYKLKKIVFKG